MTTTTDDDRQALDLHSMKTHTDYIRIVTDIVADQLGHEVKDVEADALLRQLGADSLDDVEMIMSFEEEFDIEVPDEVAEQLTTVNEIVAYLEKTIGVAEG